MRQGLTTGRHLHAERGKHVDFGLEVMMGAVGPIDEGASPLKSPLNLTKANKIRIYDASAPKQIFTRTGATNTCTVRSDQVEPVRVDQQPANAGGGRS